MRYLIHIDGAGKHGPWMGHLLSEPGCIWLATSPIAAAGAAPDAIARYFAFLRAHGEPNAPPVTADSIEVDVAEVQEAWNFGQSGGAVGLFEPDHAPLTDDDIATVIRRLGYARRNLLEAVAELPTEALLWQPQGGKRTILKNLEHVRNAQMWYLSRVLDEGEFARALPEPWPEEPFFHSLNWVQDRCVAALLNLPESRRSGLFHAEQPAEDWTPRKMARRFVEHEMEHLGVVRLTISYWQKSREEA